MSAAERLDLTFSALGDPTRRAILGRLAKGEASVTELAKPFRLTTRAISKHIAVLERAGLVSRGRDAQKRPVRLRAAPLAEASAWMDRYREFWEGSFARLDDYLKEMKKKEEEDHARRK
ncbi:MAG: metalloregulator ArsR/SmtB family transcription factor [Polyangiaceae bacterium]